MVDLKEWESTLEEGKNPCIKCREKGRDNSGDNFHYYGKGQGGYCHACEFTLVSDDIKKESKRGYSKVANKKNKPTTKNDVKNKGEFTYSDWKEIKKETSLDPKGYRGLSREACKKFQVFNEFSEETGKVVKQYYPSTVDYKIAGCAVRCEPKDFYKKGASGNAEDLFGQLIFRNSNSRDVVITGGQLDAISTHQMFSVMQKSGYEDIAVVSPTNGESGAYKQLMYHYEWLDRFERIILCFDNDDAGREATEAAVKHLPKGKVYVLNMSTRKDPNEYLMNNDTQSFWNAYWKCEKYVPKGVTASTELESHMREYVSTPRLSLPPFMRVIQKMLIGGLPLGYIVNILAACVDKDTEYFNGKGWKKISDYKEGELVSQYNPEDDSLELVKPLNYIKQPCQRMTRISTARGLDQVCSDEHNFVYWQPHKRGKANEYKKIAFKDLIEEHQSKISGFSRGAVKTCFSYSGVGIDLTEGELRLQVAVMADGRIVKEGKDNYTQMRFNKERKYIRLKELCTEFNLRFDDRGINNQGNYEVIVWPKLKDKFFNSKYYQCSRDQLEVILDEILYWDSYEPNKTYITTSKDNADFIQFAYAALGIRATISEDMRKGKYTNDYCATVYPTKNSFVGMSKGGKGEGALVEEFKTLDGFKYCFTVPTGLLILRRNGKIFITGNSGVGKSTIVNAMIIHFAKAFDFPTGVVSLEASEGEYGVNLASSYCKKKINLIETPEEKIKYLDLPENVAKRKELWENELRDPNFYIVDADVENMQSKVEYLVRGLGCKIIVFDPLQDILDELTGEEQARWMKWEKDLVKKEKISIINISHSRKSQSGAKANSRGAELNEEDMMGHSSIFKSGGINIVLGRDKEADCPIVRNTTTARITKARGTGRTGFAGQWFYEENEDQLYDKDWFFEKYPNYLSENKIEIKKEDKEKAYTKTVKLKSKSE